MRYLKQSHFSLALECITKLYYMGKKDYACKSIHDPFLDMLAKGCFQVRELAKFLFCDDPYGQKITVDTIGHAESLEETAKRLNEEHAVIAGATFSFQSLFVQADLIVKHGEIVDLYSVISKPYSGHDSDIITKRGARIYKEWIPIVYNSAYEKYVLIKALSPRNIKVQANLISVDRYRKAEIDGLNQKFKIFKTDNGIKVEHLPGIMKNALGDPMLKIENIDNVIQRVWDEFPVPTDFNENMTFMDFVDFCSEVYTKDSKTYTQLGRKCKECQFVNRDPKANIQKSGFHECWARKTNLSHKDLINKSLVIDLCIGSLGNRDLVKELTGKGKYLLETVSESDVAPKFSIQTCNGFDHHHQRIEQIRREKDNIKDSFFDKTGLQEEMTTWVYPLHMIVYRTFNSMFPFENCNYPYQAYPFQFSHHILEKNGDVYHAGQFLSFKVGVNPLYEFSDQLRFQLNKTNGTIFGYSTRGVIPVRTANFFDFRKLVLKYYCSPFAKGNMSLRKTLLAIIDESDFLKNKYSWPIYGRSRQVKSLNFDYHTWINPAYGMDPYKTLPRLIESYDPEQLDEYFHSPSGGGTAMLAYNCLQFSHIPEDQKETLKEGLLKYCELDSMAMVMILEGWLNK